MRSSASLAAGERGRLLADAAAIQAAVVTVCAVVDGIDRGCGGGNGGRAGRA